MAPATSPTEATTALAPAATRTEASTTLAMTQAKTTDPSMPTHFKTCTGEQCDCHEECDLVSPFGCFLLQ